MTEQHTEEPTTEPDALPEGDTFPRAYVEKLRTENRDLRLSNKELTEKISPMRDALRDAVMREASHGTLYEPAAWSDDYTGENGMPSLQKARQAVEVLAAEKPHLTRPKGDAGQGYRGTDSGTFDLAGMLRSGV